MSLFDANSDPLNFDSISGTSPGATPPATTPATTTTTGGFNLDTALGDLGKAAGIYTTLNPATDPSKLNAKQQLQLAQLNSQTTAANAASKSKTWTVIGLVAAGLLSLLLVVMVVTRRS